MKGLLIFTVSAFVVSATAGEVFPPLIGDGVSDDTAAIQARLDSGATLVYLPPPKKCYRISRTLRIGSETELRIDRNSVIRLAPGSDCPMLENKCYRNGQDVRITVSGGIWDFANLDQSPNPQQYERLSPPRPSPMPKCHQYDFFFGMAMRFSNLSNATFEHLTIRNPTSYGLALCKTSYFVVNDITFDYTTWNPVALNMDGVHCDGFCHHGRITALRGTCFDDLVALNANDGQCAQEEGPINDIDIDGIYADYCHSAVRLLSAGKDLRRVTIRNVHGNFYTYVVGLTHFFPEKPRGKFEDIVISDVFAGKVLAPESIDIYSRTNFPPIWVQGPVDVGRLTIRNFSREERNVDVCTLRVDMMANVRHLELDGLRMENRLGRPIPFLDIRGRVEKLTTRGLDFLPSPADWMMREQTPSADLVPPRKAETSALQGKIDEIATRGGGVLVIPKGVHLTGALYFKPGVNLHLEEGAVLLGSNEESDYPKCTTRIEGETCCYYPALVNADRCDGFTITGRGTIDGNGISTWELFWRRFKDAQEEKGSADTFRNKDLMRPRILYVSNSRNVDVSGVTFKNSKFWTTHFYQCENVLVHDCFFLAEVTKDSKGNELKGPSTDAVDIDKCKNFTVRSCRISVNDDGVVVKGGKGAWANDYARHPENGPSSDILVEDCLFEAPTHSCLTLGSECPEARRVVMRNCRMEGAGDMLYLKMRTDTPQRYTDVVVDGMTGNCSTVFHAGTWTQYADMGGRELSDLKSIATNVEIRNCRVTCHSRCNVEENAETHELRELKFKNNEIRCGFGE